MVDYAEPGGALLLRKGWKDLRARLAVGALAAAGLGWMLWSPASTDAPPESATVGARPGPELDHDAAAREPGSKVESVLPRVGAMAPPPRVDSAGPEGVEEGAGVGIRSPTGLYGGAKVEPLYDLRSDALEGVRLSRIGERSFWNLVGVRDGDVVLEINGQLVDSPNASVTLMNSMSLEPVLILRVRGDDGLERFLEYRSPGKP